MRLLGRYCAAVDFMASRVPVCVCVCVCVRVRVRVCVCVADSQ